MPRGSVEGQRLVLQFEGSMDAESIKRYFAEQQRLVEEWLVRLRPDVEGYNAAIAQGARRRFEQRRAKIEQARAALKASGLPVDDDDE